MPDRPQICLTLLLCVATLAGCDGAEADARAAVESLRAGRLTEAESSADSAAAGGGPEFAALRDFVRGSVAFARCATSEAQASGPEAEPFAFDVAIAFAETARRSWQLAATSRDDWPQARRNVERASLAIGRLKKKKADAERNRRTKSDPRGKPKSGPDKKPEEVAQPRPDRPQGEGGDPNRKPDAATRDAELPPDQVLRLLDKLAEREKEKLAVRRDRRQAKSSDVEKDW